MSTLRVSTIQDTAGSNSSTPSAIANGIAKAWIRKNSGFDGLGNAIMASFNVSSITQLSTGRWQVNFTNAMADTNYIVVLGGFRQNSDVTAGEDASNRTTTYCTIVSYNISQTRYDMGFSVAIFR